MYMYLSFYILMLKLIWNDFEFVLNLARYGH